MQNTDNTHIIDRKKRLLSIALILALGFVTVAAMLRGQELPQILPLLKQIDPLFLLLALIAMALFFACEAGALRYLLVKLGYQAGFRRCYSYALIDFYFSSVTPGCCGGQPAQIYYMSRDRIAVGNSSMALLLFNSSYHLSVLLAAGLAALLAGPGILAGLGPVKFLFIYGVAAQLLIAAGYMTAIFSPRLAPRLAGAVVSALHRLHIIRDKEKIMSKVDSQLAEFAAGAQYIRRHPSVFPILLLFTTAHVLLLYSIPFWIYQAFGLSGYGLWSLIALQAALTLSMESLPIPGGAGATEGGFMLLYAGVFGSELVLPALLLIRGVNYYAGLTVGALVTAVISRRKKPISRRAVLPLPKGAVL